MIEQVRSLLEAQAVTRVVIVDDAFDEGPWPGDIDQGLWNTFFDDWSEADEAVVAAAYGQALLPDVPPLELARDPRFLSALWSVRAQIAGATPLLEDFERTQAAKRAELQPLRELLEQDLSLQCTTVGRQPAAEVGQAQILFLDLFLGYVEATEAVEAAIARLKSVVDARRDDPPIVVLLSRSPQLAALGVDVRDKGELLGCQFRMVRKGDLTDRPAMAEQLYDLVKSRPDALRLNGFINAWDTALLESRKKFLRSIRTLDLADYGNTRTLILDAEEEPIGDYVLDLYDLHLHSILEGDAALVRAAKALNLIKWDAYTPAQFMPTPGLVAMMDGAAFQNQTRTDTEAEVDTNPKAVRLGDVYLAPAKALKKGAKAPVGPVAREVFVVLSQACDLQHAAGDQLLLLRGDAWPYGSKEVSAKAPKTPVMDIDGTLFQVEWDVLGPHTWPLKDLPRRITKGFRRVRRFRTDHALQIQQAFIGKLGRVGTLAPPPGRHPVGLRISLRTKAGLAHSLVQCDATHGDAVCLVGRTSKNNPIEWLMLSPAMQQSLREALQNVDVAELPSGAPKLADVRTDPQFYRLLKRGLAFTRGAQGGKKSLADTNYNVLQVFAAGTPIAAGKIPTNVAPIVVEVLWD